MVFIKVIKNTAFFKRYQVKNRRRREGKTDARARRKMVTQDKCKYGAKKNRLVVRFTATKCICQIVYSTILGDKVITQATSSELTKFGVPVGHTNYAAAYCTGLLIARRALAKLGLDGKFKGKEKATGDEYHVEEQEMGDDDPRPFKVILDVGLRRTTVGARMWGALKGAVDGGLHVPYNTKNFPGSKRGEGGAEDEYDADAHKDRIFGKHVQEYMESMMEEDRPKYDAHFSRFVKAGINPDDLEDMYSGAHKKIRDAPDHKKKASKGITYTASGESLSDRAASDGTQHVRGAKLSLEQRKERVAAKIAAAQARMAEE